MMPYFVAWHLLRTMRRQQESGLQSLLLTNGGRGRVSHFLSLLWNYDWLGTLAKRWRLLHRRCCMPKFFFHIRDGEAVETDPDGLEFPSLESAVLDARNAAREILAEKLVNGDRISGQRFEIAAEDGTVLETVLFRSVLDLH